MNRLLIGSADKTNLLLQLLQNETSVTVIDPTGELARAVANQLPPALTQRALYFDPADMARPIGLNILENVQAHDLHLHPSYQVVQLGTDVLPTLTGGSRAVH